MVPKWSVTQGVSPRRYACLSNIRVERIRGILQPCSYTHMAGFMFQLPFKPLTGDEVRASSSYWAQGLSSLWYHRSLLIKYRAGGWKNQWRNMKCESWLEDPPSACWMWPSTLLHPAALIQSLSKRMAWLVHKYMVTIIIFSPCSVPLLRAHLPSDELHCFVSEQCRAGTAESWEDDKLDIVTARSVHPNLRSLQKLRLV